MKKRGMGAVFLALPLSATAFLGMQSTASADVAAPPFWVGTESSGAVLADENSPIEMRKEKLTLSVPRLEYPSPVGSVTAEYELFNPTSEDIRTTFILPMGHPPEGMRGDANDSDEDAYTVTADGRSVGCTLRHFFCGDAYGALDLDRGMQELYPQESELYRDETTVYVHTVEASVPRREEDGYDYVSLAVAFEGSAKNTRVFSTGGADFFIHDGRGELIRGYPNDAGRTERVTLYAVGEDISLGEMKAVRYRSGRKEKDGEATVEEISCTQTSFGALSAELCERCEAESFSRDWKRAFVFLLEESRIAGTCMCTADPYSLQQDSFLRCYEYSLDIPAGQTVRSSVTAPLYPKTVDFGSRQDLYEFTYLLSPASRWAKFGGIDITIETPYFLSDGSFSFRKTETGYEFSRDSLPWGELTFTLTEQARVYPVYSPDQGGGENGALITAIVLVSVVAVGTGVVVTIVAVRSKKRKKKREEEENRLLMGRAEEGTIDLPPAPPAETPDAPSEGDSSSEDPPVSPDRK